MTGRLSRVHVFLIFAVGLLALQPTSSIATTGVMVPLYVKPGTEWDNLVLEKNTYPVVPFVAIVNPSNGPGDSKNDDYYNGIQQLRAAGISVLGYVHTNYTSRDSQQVKNDIDNYTSWYPQLNGIFFDEMSHGSGNEAYYWNLNNYTKTKNMNFTVGNAGVPTLPSYFGTVDNIVIYDFYGLPNIGFFDVCCKNYDKHNLSFLAYNVTLDQDFVKNATNYVSYLYMTNDMLPNQWDTIPPYFDGLISILNATADSIVDPTITDPPTPTLSVDNIASSPTYHGWHNKKVEAYVTIVDGNKNKIDHAMVSAQLNMDSKMFEKHDKTDKHGRAVIELHPVKKASTYSLCISNVFKAGYAFDGVKPCISGILK